MAYDSNTPHGRNSGLGGTASDSGPRNDAFTLALDKHIEKLKPAQKSAFKAAFTELSPEGLLKHVQDFDADQHATCSHAETVNNVFGVVDQLMRAVTIGIQSHPELASLIVGAMRLVIDVGVRYATFLPKLVTMLSELSQYLDVLRSFVNRINNEGAPNVSLIVKSVSGVYGDWLDFCKEVQKVFTDKHGKPRRLLSIRLFLRAQWEPFETSFGPIKERFKGNLQLLLHSSQAAQYNDMYTILAKLSAISTSQEEKDSSNTRRDFMQWISSIDFDDDHQRISSSRHPGTGDWLINRQDFQAWVSSETSRLLWCYGKPGCGKSVLASYTLEHISWKAAASERIGLGFCYFNYKQAEYQGPRQILASFIKQLCWYKSVLPLRLLAFYRKHIFDARTPSYESIEEALSVVADEFDEAYLVIDALDECKSDLREQIINSVVDLSEAHACVKVFITSRPEVDIKHMFRRLNTPSVSVEAKNTADDIRKYVVDSVKTLRDVGKLRLQYENTATAITETLVSRADGMFLWVFLQLQNLCRQRIDRDILDELERLPPDLNTTYYSILGVIEELTPRLRALAQRSLMLVFFAARPLQAVELIDLAAVTAGFDDMKRSDMNRYSQDDILEACANLLIVDGGVIQPSHFSVQEYFTSNKAPEERLSTYFSDVLTGNGQIATACLRYLHFDFLKGGVCRTAFSLDARLQRFPSARYAAQYFDYHLSTLEEVDDDLQNRLLRLLQQPPRAFSAILQLRYMRKGSYTGIPGDFDSTEWEVSAATLLSLTKLRTALDYEPSLDRFEDVPYAMHLACAEGLEGLVREMIEAGWSVQHKSQSGFTPFFYAVKGSSPSLCQLLSYTRGSDWDSRVSDFHLAIQPGNENFLRVLTSGIQDHENHLIPKVIDLAVERNVQGALWSVLDTLRADGRMQSRYLASILPELARRGRYQLFAMLQQGGWFDDINENLDKALQWSCVRCDFRMAELLLDLGADFDWEIDANIWEAAIPMQGPSKDADRLIGLEQWKHQHKTKVDWFRKNALAVAILFRSAPITELLLTKGAKIQITDPDHLQQMEKRSQKGSAALYPKGDEEQNMNLVLLRHAPYLTSRNIVHVLRKYKVIPNYEIESLWREIGWNSEAGTLQLKPYLALEDRKIEIEDPDAITDFETITEKKSEQLPDSESDHSIDSDGSAQSTDSGFPVRFARSASVSGDEVDFGGTDSSGD